MHNEKNYNRDIFAANLRALMKKQRVRQSALASLLGVSRSSVSAYCGGLQMPRMDKLQQLSAHFGVTLRELLECAPEGGGRAESIYASLNAQGKKELLRYGRSLQSAKEYAEKTPEHADNVKHYSNPAAAGYASPVEGEDYEILPRTAEVPKDADFCITVHGDSMLPYIKDGDLVYVRRDVPLEEFDVGIFYVDGDVYCKQWCVDYSGTLRLLSANPQRQSANISIPKDSGRSCVCFGKVLLPKRLPRPTYY